MSANDLTIETLLRAHAPHAPESLRERVFALEPKERRLSLPSRRLVLVALPAAEPARRARRVAGRDRRLGCRRARHHRFELAVDDGG